MKRFPGVLANDNVDLDIKRGEIHALLGENGAGKSTLMNILYGVYQPDSGEIFLNGRPVSIQTPRDAIRLKIGMIHQNFMQIPNFTVTENILLALKNKHEPFLDIPGAEARIKRIAESLGFTIDPGVKVSTLSIGDRQRVEIIKALYKEAEVLILDEPTSVLTPQGTRDLFRLLGELIQRGISVVFITHKLEEIMSVADRVTVLRLGKKVATLNRAETNTRELARLMVGREVLYDLKKQETRREGEVLRVEDLRVLNRKKIVAVDGVSLTVCRGEIVGIAGVIGNGQSELNAALCGLLPVSQGRIIMSGRDLTNAQPREILKCGVGFIPEDQNDGFLINQEIWENLILNGHGQPPFADRFGRILFKNAYEYSRELVEKFSIKVRSIHALPRELSGGHRQRLILARELSRHPQLLVAAHPTRGLDVGAEEYIQQQLELGKEQGMGILLISTKLEETMRLSDRIVVMYKGRVMDILDRTAATVEQIGLLMAGVTP
ncbi:MAG: ABC transporter ATP-binding protein [Candidatus Auribacterota bacterium]|nr:ABC transporter ATP-binding protein [Candidatus Auribacterota bacterium]